MTEIAPIDVTINPDDVRLFYVAARSRSGGARNLHFFVSAIVSAATVISVTWLLRIAADFALGPALAVSMVLGFLLGTAACIILSRRTLRKSFDSDGSFLEPKQLWFASDGFHVDGPKVRTFVSWRAVQDVIATDAHVFIMIDRIVGVIVPKRCFASRENIDAFVAEVRRHIAPPHGEGAT